MPSIRINVTGLDQTINALNNAPPAFINAKRNILNQTSDFMVSELKRNAHVITGRMKASIRKQQINDSSVLVEVGVPYASYENRRPGLKVGSGPHNFADRAENATKARMSSIVSSEYAKVFSSLKT